MCRVSRAVFVVCCPSQQHGLPRPGRPAKDGSEVADGWGGEFGVGQCREAAMSVVAKDGQPPAAPGANHQIVPAVAVRVHPAHARSELAQFA
jgi:hypothetical protein